jgi:hypothetical protein
MQIKFILNIKNKKIKVKYYSLQNECVSKKLLYENLKVNNVYYKLI